MLPSTNSAFAVAPANTFRTAFILALFLGGIATGVIAYRLVDNPDQANPFPSLEKTALEPRVTAALADAIRNEDPKALAQAIDQENLGKMREALQPTGTPIAEVRSLVFKGAVTNSSGRTLAAYVATVRDMNGTDIPVGFVLQVQDDQIVGVN
jgi:hypothetical protein